MSSTSESLQAKGLAWLKSFFATADALDARKWIEGYWQPDAVVQFANAPELRGQQVAISAMEPFFSLLGAMHHEVIWAEVARDKILAKCMITYRVKGDPENEAITVPGFAVAYFPHELQADSTGERVSRLEVYIDRRPVEDRVAALGK
ncbi:hypothetical protein HDZ31DRAFT_44608 [Schizophyllum fasciatum]